MISTLSTIVPLSLVNVKFYGNFVQMGKLTDTLERSYAPGQVPFANFIEIPTRVDLDDLLAYKTR